MDDKVIYFKTKHCNSFKERAKELIGKQKVLREDKIPNCKKKNYKTYQEVRGNELRICSRLNN